MASTSSEQRWKLAIACVALVASGLVATGFVLQSTYAGDKKMATPYPKEAAVRPGEEAAVHPQDTAQEAAAPAEEKKDD